MQKISFKDYLKHDGISRSKLNLLLKSKWHYQNDVTPTRAMNLGSYVHERLLEPDEDSFALEPEVNKRTKVGKEEYQNFLDNLGDKIPLTLEQKTLGDSIVEQFRGNPIANGLLEMAEYKEASTFQEDLGHLFKARFDLVSIESSFVADIKTTKDASPEGFAKSMANFNYHFQAAYYLKMANLACGTDIKDFIFIACETVAPFGIAVYRIEESAIEVGNYLFDQAVNKLNNIDQLPRVYEEVIQAIDIPAWAKKRTGYEIY